MTEKKSPAQYACIFCFLLCTNLPFMVVDLISYTEVSSCTTTPMQGIDINLSLWLFVDGLARAAMLSLFFFSAIFSCINFYCGAKSFCVSMIVSIIYSILNIGWLIIGALLFWGNLYPSNLCDTHLTGYMFSVLIIGFCGVCMNLCTGFSQF